MIGGHRWTPIHNGGEDDGDEMETAADEAYSLN